MATAKKVEDIAEALKRGEDIKIPGVGALKIVHKAARSGRNPATGAEVSIPAQKGVKFSIYPSFKSVLNEA